MKMFTVSLVVVLLFLGVTPAAAQVRARARVNPMERNVGVMENGAPASLQVVVKNAATVVITWGEGAGATGYEVLMDRGGNVTTLASLPATVRSYTHTTAPTGETVAYRVSASSNLTRIPGETAWKTVTLPPAPPAPTRFTATPDGADAVNLNWSGAPGAVAYTVGRHIINGASTELGARCSHTRTSYRDKDVPPGNYAYSVESCPGRAGFDLAGHAISTNVVVGAKSGRYRISLTGFKVDAPTNDLYTFGDTDGPNDEIFLAVHVVDHDTRRSDPFRQQTVKSIQYNDMQLNEAMPFGMSACDRSVVAMADRAPLRVWEGELVEGKNVVLVVPTIWEWDNQPKAYTQWAGTAQSYPGRGAGFWGPHLAAASISPATGLSTRFNDDSNFERYGADFDRPIGSLREMAYAVFADQVVPFSYTAVENALNSTSAIGSCGGPGVVEVVYRDASERHQGWDDGVYTLYLQVERM